MTAPNATTDARPRGGKFLTFFLGDEEYGAEILKVQEIIGMQPITRVPRTPAFIRGVINLRGKVIPIMDLRERFQMDAAQADDAAAAALRCIIVVHVAGPQGQVVPVGIVVVAVALVDERRQRLAREALLAVARPEALAVGLPRVVAAVVVGCHDLGRAIAVEVADRH